MGNLIFLHEKFDTLAQTVGHIPAALNVCRKIHGNIVHLDPIFIRILDGVVNFRIL